MFVKTLPTLGDNYMYVVSDGTHAAAIDPSVGRSALRAAEEMGVHIDSVLLTHHHLDHTGGCREISTETQCSIVGPRDIRLPMVDHPADDGDIVVVGDLELQVIASPGHTRSHVAYYCPGHGCLWTGDSLFMAGCGRVFEGGYGIMWKSLQRFRELPPDTQIYCGHNYTLENLEFAHHLEPQNPEVKARLDECRELERRGADTVPSRLSTELATNPFLRSDDPSLCEAAGLAGRRPGDVFKMLRLMKDRW